MTSSGLPDSFERTKNSVKNPKYISVEFSRYNFLFLGAVCLPIIVVGFLNWAIDPYDLFDTPNYWGINHEKPKKDSNDRIFKAADIIRIKPQIVIIGSSRIKQGIDPEHSVFKGKLQTYNLAINSPNFYEVRRYLEHALANQPDIQEIILGVDFFMFNDNLKNRSIFNEARIEKKHIIVSDAVKALFSLDTLATSFDTIKASQENPDVGDNYGEDGFMPKRNFDNGKTVWRFNKSIALQYRHHSNHQFSQRYWSDYQKVVELCQQNNIELKVLIPPAHATQWESIYITERWDSFEQWKRELVKLTPVWDFSGYNSITTEAIAERMNNYVDHSHYTPAVGDLILNRIYSRQTEKIPKDFGVLLTTENVEQHLAQIRHDRLLWLSARPEEVQLVRDLKPESN